MTSKTSGFLQIPDHSLYFSAW